MPINQEAVELALRSVIDPVFGRSMIELGSLTEITLQGDTVTMTAKLSAVSDGMQKQVASAVESALAPLGAHKVDLRWKLEVPMRRTNADDPVPSARNIILVMSGKGGVGKSTCAANLALALHRGGARVGLLDADIYGPSVPTMLGVSGHPRASGERSIEPLERFGMKLMSIGFLIESAKEAIIWRGPMVQGALNQFLADVAWGPLDFLVLDMPPGTGDVALSLAQRLKVTGAVIVTTPQELALQDVYKSVSMCKKLNVPMLGVIENMSFFVDPAGNKHEIFGTGGGQKIADFAEAPLLGQIPLDTAVRQWGDDGTPIVHALPEHPTSRAFTQIAEALSVRIAREAFERAGGEKVPDTQAPRRLKIMR